MRERGAAQQPATHVDWCTQSEEAFSSEAAATLLFLLLLLVLRRLFCLNLLLECEEEKQTRHVILLLFGEADIVSFFMLLSLRLPRLSLLLLPLPW